MDRGDRADLLCGLGSIWFGVDQKLLVIKWLGVYMGVLCWIWYLILTGPFDNSCLNSIDLCSKRWRRLLPSFHYPQIDFVLGWRWITMDFLFGGSAVIGFGDNDYFTAVWLLFETMLFAWIHSFDLARHSRLSYCNITNAKHLECYSMALGQKEDEPAKMQSK